MKDCSIPTANALETLQFCTKPSIYHRALVRRMPSILGILRTSAVDGISTEEVYLRMQALHPHWSIWVTWNTVRSPPQSNSMSSRCPVPLQHLQSTTSASEVAPLIMMAPLFSLEHAPYNGPNTKIMIFSGNSPPNVHHSYHTLKLKCHQIWCNFRPWLHRKLSF